MRNRIIKILIETIAVILVLGIFGLPMTYVFLNAGKTPVEAAEMKLSLSANPQYLKNFYDVVSNLNFMIIRAFFNSIIITLMSIVILIIISAPVGYVLARRKSKIISLIYVLILSGLMIPPAIVPTIWILKVLGLYKTLISMVFIEISLSFSFSVLLFRAHVATIPKELDEASFIDGCNSIQLFVHVIFPLLKPVAVTVAILTSLIIFNDFVNPLYFLPGAKNVTIQMTLYNFISQYRTEWNLLFANVLLISIPPLLFFIIFNKKIVSGMIAGSVKG